MKCEKENCSNEFDRLERRGRPQRFCEQHSISLKYKKKREQKLNEQIENQEVQNAT